MHKVLLSLYISLSCFNKFKFFKCSFLGLLHALVADVDVQDPNADWDDHCETESVGREVEAAVVAGGAGETNDDGLDAGAAFLQGARDGGAPTAPDDVDDERQPGELGVGVNEGVHNV